MKYRYQLPVSFYIRKGKQAIDIGITFRPWRVKIEPVEQVYIGIHITHDLN